jgi:hydroxyacylglutathione hydrolase
VHIETFSVGPLGCNCSILADLEAKRAIVIDPGGDFAQIRERLEARGLAVDAIVHTHTHIDHVGATKELQDLTGARAEIHEGDRFLYDLLPVQSAMLGMPPPPVVTDLGGALVDGATFHAGSIELAVLHTPGHTPGSVCFVAGTGDATRIFAGDTLFRRSIGRTDLWGGDGEQIKKSIRQKLLTLDPNAVVIAGHGDTTTIGEERAKNPFVAIR